MPSKMGRGQSFIWPDAASAALHVLIKDVSALPAGTSGAMVYDPLAPVVPLPSRPVSRLRPTSVPGCADAHRGVSQKRWASLVTVGVSL